MPRLVFVVLVLFGAESFAAAPPVSHAEWARKSTGRFAYGLYMRGQKIGWTIDELKLGMHQGQRVVVSTNETYMQTQYEGVRSVREEKTTTKYELTGDGAIVFAEEIRREDGQEKRYTVERIGERLRIVQESGKNRSERQVPSPKDTLALQRKLEYWLAGPRRKGDQFTKYNANWEKVEVNSPQRYEYRSSREMTYQGIATRILAVRITSQGGHLDAELFPDSRMWSGTMGGLLQLKLEPEKQARALDRQLVELQDLTSIVIDVDLGPARLVDSLKLEVSGLGEFEIPQSHRQRVSPDKKRTLVELQRDFRVDNPQPLSEQEQKQYTRSTPQYQSDQKPILDLARKLVGDEKDSLAKARRIEAWVYRTLRKSYADNADTALAVLETKAGDCTEHSLLFVALCRAAGIPAREVGGLAYSPGSKPMFGWHAWAEIHDGHQWVSVDPTWNQVYVDGTHLKLSTDEDDLAYTNILGTLKLKVLDVKSRGR